MALTRGIDHVATLSSSLDLTVRLYQEVFEAAITVEAPKTDDQPRVTVLDLGGGAFLNVYEVPAEAIVGDRRKFTGRGAIDHFALAVDSPATLELVRKRLVDAGVTEVGEIEQDGNEWSLFFRDPDGMDVQICCTSAD
jgi:catechol 2,3-dioxygenase-like lactoylglutathione lyase family enzyme